MAPNNSAPTLEDVATEAGVSTATVSRCLNDPDKVSKTTYEIVISAIENLGYTPNFGAKAMAAKRTFTIGAIIPTMANAVFARGLQAFQEALNEQGYTLLVSSSAYSPELEADQIRSLVSRGADGLLLIGYERDDALYDFLAKRGVPALVAWTFKPNTNLPSVGFDNVGAMVRLTDEVISMGHKDIAYISGTLRGNDRATARLEGVKRSLSKNGLDPAAMPVLQTPYSIKNGAAVFEKLMSAARRPTVVMCGNDVLAAGAIQKSRELGIRVPEDVSVTGFDDLEIAEIVSPQLTTVQVPHRDMGKKAAEMLINLVENKAQSNPIELKSTLKLRQSLSAPRKKI